MSEAIITGIVGIVVCMINNYFQHRKTLSLIEYRLKQLEQKVDKHNHFDDRIHDMETTIKVFDEKLKVANNRIADLERE